MGFEKNIAYEASAGSGKTFMLVVRYLTLLFQGADPAKILTLTFTNKAASEMSERIGETLEDLPNRAELSEIAQASGLGKEVLLSQRHEVLHRFLNASTKIMTIDSFFTKILRKFSLYAGLMPDFTTASAQHEIKLLKRFLLEVEVANKRGVLVDLALESQKRVSDIFALLEQIYENQHQLDKLHFSAPKTRAHEIEALEALEGIKTIVHGCKGASAKLLSAVSIESFEELLRATWVYKPSLEYWVFKKCFNPEMDRHLRTIQEAIRTHYKVKEASFFSRLFELVALYKKAKTALYQEDGELSFGDVTLLVYEILHRFETSEFLYFRLDATIEHILLDEFQDTSIIQYEILRPLIEEVVAGSGIFEDGSFFFVGDVKQSIYRFRGGVSALFSQVAHNHGTKIAKLRTNYRSQKEVVDFVNRIFEHKMPHYTPQEVKEGANGGYVEVVNNDEVLEEVLFWVQKLRALGAKSDEIAVLCATNSDGEEIKNLLVGEGIEVVTETTTKLIHQKSVRAVLEYLKYLYFGKEIYQENFFALLNREVEAIPRFDFTDKTVVEIVKHCIERYGLFEGNGDLLRFLEVVSRYRDIEALLFEYERIDTSAPSSQIEGVRVLTIHKSKGLEYEHVIVMDRLKKAPPARNTIIYEYEGIELRNIFLRTQSREMIDPSYAHALTKEQALSLEDRLNALYVAFTRARTNLIVVQKGKDSLFELLELEPSSFGELVCSSEAQESKTPKQPFEYKELFYGTQSEVLSTPKSHEDDLDALYFGIATHYTLEMMESFDASSLQSALIATHNKYGLYLGDAIVSIEKRIEQLLHESTFCTLVDGGVCYKEQGFKKGKQLRYIDLLVEHEDRFVVIDYKTGKNHQEEHHKQVRYYVDALKENTQKEVSGYLCYLLESGVEVVRVC